MKRTDRAIGIVAGIVLGVGIVIAFVFFGSEGTIDAPRIDHGQSTTQTQGNPKPEKPKPATRTAQVTIAGGAPPASGPAQLTAREGDTIHLEVSSDETVDVELLGYDITRTVDAGKATDISFKASKTGNFPLTVVASHIAVAQIRIAAR